MSMYNWHSKFREILLSCRPFIVKHLVCIDDVTDALISDGVLTSSLNEEIKALLKDSDKIRFLLDFINKKGDREFQLFCAALKATGNEHIASKLSIADDNNTKHDLAAPFIKNIHRAMNDDDKCILRKLRVQFVKNMLDVEGVIDVLYSRDIIKESHKSIILRHSERQKQVRALLDILSKCHGDTMSVFILALEETENIALVRLIKRYT